MALDALLARWKGHRSRRPDKPKADVSELRATLGLDDSDDEGEGIGVAILDSGLELSPDFDARPRGVLGLHAGRREDGPV